MYVLHIESILVWAGDKGTIVWLHVWLNPSLLGLETKGVPDARCGFLVQRQWPLKCNEVPLMCKFIIESLLHHYCIIITYYYILYCYTLRFSGREGVQRRICWSIFGTWPEGSTPRAGSSVGHTCLRCKYVPSPAWPQWAVQYSWQTLGPFQTLSRVWINSSWKKIA